MLAATGATGRTGPADEAAFYCVSSSQYFLGAVGMINSLCLHGHTEPIYLLDLGLEDWQRALLEPRVTVVDAPAGIQPWLAKTVAPLAHPAATTVLIDADVIVTRPLDELLERAGAGAGSAIAFRNNVDRFVPEWGDLLDLGPLPRRPYVCSVFLATGGRLGEEVLRLLDDRQRKVEFERTYFGGDDTGYALRFLDQDVLNAVLAARAEGERFEALDHRLAAPMPFVGVRVTDEAAVRCEFEDGTEPYLLHHILPAKPWLEPMPDGIYPRLLKRLLSGPDLAIRVPAARLPLRFRSGALAAAERRRSDTTARLRWRLGLALDRIRR